MRIFEYIKMQTKNNLVQILQEINSLHAGICSALADPSRILILYTLATGSYNVSDLAAEVGLSQPAASRHLKILREHGLVYPERQGASVNYQLADPRLIDALDILRAVLHNWLAHKASILNEVTSL